MVMKPNARVHRLAFDSAINQLDVLRDVHLVLAPLRPTDEMIEAVCKAMKMTPIQAQMVYEVMIRASIPDTVDDGLI